MLIRFSQLALLSILAFGPYCHAEEASEPPAEPPADHWGFNLSLYAWLAGLNGDFSVGSLSRSVDASFIDLADESRRFPLGFMGRFEAHYDRFGLYVDGNYMSLRLNPRFQRLSNGLDSDLGLMDYGLMYRLVGPTADEIPSLHGQRRPNRLDVYVGARTLWTDNSVYLSGPGGRFSRGFSASRSFTSPQIGGRFIVDFTPEIFMLVDGNVGGFGADDVSFTGSILGMVGYRLAAFGVPLSIQAGYNALRYEVKGGDRVPMKARATLNGPVIGLTAYW